MHVLCRKRRGFGQDQGHTHTKGAGREGQEQTFGDWCLKLRESVSKKEEICFYKDKQVRELRKIHWICQDNI